MNFRATVSPASGAWRIGPGEPCFVLAEAGVNHNGRLELALRLIEAAARSGAAAVKFQTFSADRLAAAEAPKAQYQIGKGHQGESESQRDMLRRLELDEGAYPVLIDAARRNGIAFLSSPFDEESADLLERFGVEAFKIPSGELTNHPYLAHIARKGKPMIVSTGMATLAEVEESVEVIRAAGGAEIVLLHCVSSYPAPAGQINLRAMDTLRDRFHVPTGFSDHTEGIEIPLAAVARGAVAIEKHLTLDRALPGPDHTASLEPAEFARMTTLIREIESALGSGEKKPAPCEQDCARVARKSLFAVRAIRAGEALTASSVSAMRPGVGIPPSRLPQVLGRAAVRDIREGELLTMEAFA